MLGKMMPTQETMPLDHVLFLIRLIRLQLSQKLGKKESLGSILKQPIIKKLSFEQVKESIIIVKSFWNNLLFCKGGW